MKFNRYQPLAIALLLGAFTARASADSANSIHAAKINSANELVRAGEFAKAVEDYREIPVTDFTQDELNYNSGVALYRQGELDAARALFRETSTSGNNTLAAAARYNLGNCSYSDAVATAQQDKQAAIVSLDQAITQYRASLRVDPNHVDARANIELAVTLRTKLEEELKQEQQQEQKQQEEKQQENQDQQQDPNPSEQEQNQDQESQEQQDADQQKPNDEKSEGEKSEEEKPESAQSPETEQAPPQDSDSDADQKQEDQQAASDESDMQENDQQESDQQESDQPEEQAQQQPTEQDSDQNATPESQSQSAENEKSEQQDDLVPSGELKPANEPQEADERPGAVAVASGDEELMTKEEALKMLQAVRDRDMLRRLRQEQSERNRHVPTDRDW